MSHAVENAPPSRPVVIIFGVLLLFACAIPLSIVAAWVAVKGLDAIADGKLVTSLLYATGFVALAALALYLWVASLVAMRSDRRGIAMGVIPLVLIGLMQIWMFPVVCLDALSHIEVKHLGYAFGFTLYILLVVLAFVGAGSNKSD